MMKTDMELLQLAAKAAGIVGYMTQPFTGLHVTGRGDWNPLANDGDALRLAAQLSIGVSWCMSGRICAHNNGLQSCESSRENRADNMRRAIVRVAAEIGEAMQ